MHTAPKLPHCVCVRVVQALARAQLAKASSLELSPGASRRQLRQGSVRVKQDDSFDDDDDDETPLSAMVMMHEPAPAAVDGFEDEGEEEGDDGAEEEEEEEERNVVFGGGGAAPGEGAGGGGDDDDLARSPQGRGHAPSKAPKAGSLVFSSPSSQEARWRSGGADGDVIL